MYSMYFSRYDNAPERCSTGALAIWRRTLRPVEGPPRGYMDGDARRGHMDAGAP